MLTYFNQDKNAYEVRIPFDKGIYYRTESEERINNGVVLSEAQHFISGFVVDALAEYENTGLTPYEIKEMKLTTLKNLQSSNKMLQKMNDELSDSYGRLLNENHKLKCLLKDYLNSVT